MSEGVTYKCATETVRLREFRPAYDNGLNGNVNLANYTSPMDAWPAAVKTYTVPEGVWIGPSFATEARVWPWNNGTAQPNASAAPKHYTAWGPPATWPTPTVRLLSFDVRFNPADLMNGATEFYYMSPVKPDANFSHHFVEVRELDGDIIAGDMWSHDGLGYGGALVAGRYVYRLAGIIQTGTTYTVHEYAVTNGTPPAGVSRLDVYLAPDQDVAGDGLTGFRAFPGESVEVTVPHEMAFSFKFTAGISNGGPMGAYVYRAQADGKPVSTVKVEQGSVRARNAIPNANQVRLVVPLETTVPLNVTITLTPSAGWTGTPQVVTRTGVTGTLIEEIPVTGFASTASAHEYQVKLSVDFDMSGNPGLAGFKLPASERRDANGDAHVHVFSEWGNAVSPPGCDVAQCPWSRELRPGQFWTEIYEENAAAPAEASFSVNAPDALVGLALFTFGVFLVSVGVAAPLGIAIAAYGGSVLVRALVTGEEGIIEGDMARLLDAALKAAEAAAPIVAVAACGGMWFAPGAWKVGAGALCALAGSIAGLGLPGLVDFLIKIPEILTTIGERVGEGLAWALDVAKSVHGAVIVPVQFVFQVFVLLFVVLLVREALLWWLAFMRVMLLALHNLKALRFVDSLRNQIATVPIPLWDTLFFRKWSIRRGEYLAPGGGA